MIVLGIDPGTAALGYGIVERTRGPVREVDHGCLETSPGPVAPGAPAGDPRARRRAARARTSPTVVAVERLFFSKNVQTAFAVGPGPRRRAAGGRAARRARPRGDARARSRAPIAGLRRRRQGAGPADGPAGPRAWPSVPRPDDAADALAIAVWAANTRARRSGRATAAVMDRAAVAPDRARRVGVRAGRPRGARPEKAAERDAKRAAKRTAS